jgi:hypothetical protein
VAGTVDRWSVELSIQRHEHETRADARLIMGDDGHVLGHGVVRPHPRDPDITEIDEMIAVARALSDLAHIVLGSAAAELEDITHERAHLHL